MAKNNQQQFDDFGQEIDRGYPMKRKGGKRLKNNVINIKPARNPTPMSHDKNQSNHVTEKSVVEETTVTVTVNEESAADQVTSKEPESEQSVKDDADNSSNQNESSREEVPPESDNDFKESSKIDDAPVRQTIYSTVGGKGGLKRGIIAKITQWWL